MTAQCYDRASNMMGPKSGVSTRAQQLHPMAIANYCLCHGSSLAVKNAFKEILFLEVWFEKLKDLAKLFKKSPQREQTSHNAKDKASCDSLWDRPSEAPKLIDANPTRWTENKKCFNVVKLN